VRNIAHVRNLTHLRNMNTDMARDGSRATHLALPALPFWRRGSKFLGPRSSFIGPRRIPRVRCRSWQQTASGAGGWGCWKRLLEAQSHFHPGRLSHPSLALVTNATHSAATGTIWPSAGRVNIIACHRGCAMVTRSNWAMGIGGGGTDLAVQW
jgi:hypothetical protein